VGGTVGVILTIGLIQNRSMSYDGGLDYRDSQGDFSFSRSERQSLESAKTAEEWMKRLKLDVEKSSYHSDFLVNLYAELPPKNEWPELINSLEKFAGDVSQIKKMMKFNGHGNQPSMTSHKLSILCALLKDGNADIEPQVRKLVLSANGHDIEQSTALLMVSKDQKATLEWIKKNRPSSLKSESYSHSGGSDKDKSDWEVAFAKNKIDEGIELLKKEIAKSDKSKAVESWGKLIQIGMLTDRMPLAVEATNNIKKILLQEIKNDSHISSYGYRSFFDLHLKNQEWQAIVDTFNEISAAYNVEKKSRSNGDFGYFDQVHTTYLTALYQLGKSDEFVKGIEAAQKAFHDNPDQFFEFLVSPIVGHKPLGILYVEHLNKIGEKDDAITYALHLLVRNQGKDVFYETLINLDLPRARLVIASVQEFDSFEERPLIWQAELARKDGDLELALKTIEQAIALDPSDGDHGKDSRMFCYEVLARIHSDADRKDKADFFRSVVDSIRQGEAADDFLYAGLIDEATLRYRKALGKFEDAYCLQSRLAMTLARNGQFDESVKHFKKAFELMPVSFGPRESHCFGCEGLFDDPRVVEIALPLLKEFEKSNPENPRTPYLLGLVLAEKNNNVQAAIAYRRAFEIDPKYFNAAYRLLSILEKDPKMFGEAEALREKIYVIAPYSKKPTYMPKQAQLSDHWELTENFPPSPFKLPKIPFIVENKSPVDQYITIDGDVYHHYYSFGDSESFDGWTANELRRANTFLKALDGIY
jgi:tetratricopeptide (TPR) repeat protein